MSGLFRLLQQKLNPPKDDVDSKVFDGRVVLITGATTGLGLEAAKKLVARGIKKLIITARDVKRGQAAKAILEATATVTSSITKIDVLLLNMSSFDGVKTFVEEINTEHHDLDTAILNAGTIQTKWTKSADGYEEIIQVNTISTVLLGVLLIPALERSSTLKRPAHLTFVSSGTALRVKASDFVQFADKDVVQAMSEERSWCGGQIQYARSKLLLEYAMRRIAQLPQLRDGNNGEVKVVVNSTCPGMCKSDLGRQYKTNLLIVILVWVLYRLARTTEQGARIYISAVNRGADSQGQLWKDDRYYDGGEMIGTAQGDKLGDDAWKEMMQLIVKTDPSAKSILASQ